MSSTIFIQINSGLVKLLVFNNAKNTFAFFASPWRRDNYKTNEGSQREEGLVTPPTQGHYCLAN